MKMKRIDRVELKRNAKQVLRKYYWAFFLVSLVVALLGGNSNYSSGGSSSGGSNSNRNNTANMINVQVGNTSVVIPYSEISSETKTIITNVTGYGYDAADRTFIGRVVKAIFVAGVAVLSLIIIAVAFCFTFLVAFPFSVGGAKVYIKTADFETKPEFRDLVYAYKCGRFWNIAKAGFLKSLYTFLWSLLFVVPGIVKGYAYSMTPYILADNPSLDASSALRLSQAMTKGYKWDIFVTQLSFWGWYLLGSALFGLGVLFVNPYRDATMAQVYLTLRDNAIETGMAVPENFGLTSEEAAAHDDVMDYREPNHN